MQNENNECLLVLLVISSTSHSKSKKMFNIKWSKYTRIELIIWLKTVKFWWIRKRNHTRLGENVYVNLSICEWEHSLIYWESYIIFLDSFMICWFLILLVTTRCSFSHNHLYDKQNTLGCIFFCGHLNISGSLRLNCINILILIWFFSY